MTAGRMWQWRRETPIPRMIIRPMISALASAALPSQPQLGVLAFNGPQLVNKINITLYLGLSKSTRLICKNTKEKKTALRKAHYKKISMYTYCLVYILSHLDHDVVVNQPNYKY